MSLAKDAVDFAKARQLGDLTFPNTVGSVGGTLPPELQTIAERAGVMELRTSPIPQMVRQGHLADRAACPSLSDNRRQRAKPSSASVSA